MLKIGIWLIKRNAAALRGTVGMKQLRASIGLIPGVGAVSSHQPGVRSSDCRTMHALWKDKQIALKQQLCISFLFNGFLSLLGREKKRYLCAIELQGVGQD